MFRKSGADKIFSFDIFLVIKEEAFANALLRCFGISFCAGSCCCSDPCFLKFDVWFGC
jgi:hypothetical protein